MPLEVILEFVNHLSEFLRHVFESWVSSIVWPPKHLLKDIEKRSQSYLTRPLLAYAEHRQP